MNKFYAYILKSESADKHYYGHTADIDKRLSDHNLGLSKYTKRYKPWILIYSEEFVSRAKAIKRENFFKSYDGYKWLKEERII